MGNIEILIEDEGMGMNPEFIPKVFDPFTQESQGFNRSHEGLGLGLTIARRYVSSLGGHVDIEGRADKGTRVTVLLPILDQLSPYQISPIFISPVFIFLNSADK